MSALVELRKTRLNNIPVLVQGAVTPIDAVVSAATGVTICDLLKPP